ncbi:MAG: Vitamin B12 import ATP-binding protein BtuD [Candidatus Celerinatantimonas neptuna]|nr:MAG: Vitamin B12 import ATP-binding protein BtuD [Candidatus Celerinatantimonas neptuna]
MNFDWGYFFSLFSMHAFWRACVIVVCISSLSWGLGLVLGFVMACAKMSKNRVVAMAAKTYVWFFRSVPLLVLLVFVYNLPQLFPFTSSFLSIPFVSGLVSMVLTEAAYMAEIHRGGLLSVSKGQREAGYALNIGFLGIQRLIIIPQAIRIAMPAMINEYVTIIKLSSLVSVISLPELLLTGQRLYAENFLVLETLLAVAVYYVVIVTILGAFLQWLEHRMDISIRRPETLDPSACETLRRQAVAPKIQRIDKTPGVPPALQLQQLRKSYGGHTVLKNVDLNVGVGEVVSIIGPSGSGKTTLIRTINTLERLDQGEIILFGESFIQGDSQHEHRRIRQGMQRIGMVFQSFNLFPHKNALENVMMAALYHCKPADNTLNQQQALYLLDQVGLLEHAYKYPHQLSGGQQQRVAIARTLALSPDIILFDEPTSALDPEMVGEVLKVIQDLAREGMTLVIVTHEMDFALSVSDRVVMMEHGVIQVDASPHVIRQGPSEQMGLSRIRDFMGVELA